MILFPIWNLLWIADFPYLKNLTKSNSYQTGQQPQNAIQENPLTVMTNALTMPVLFGDERDSIIAKLNQLQALWGHGKAYDSAAAQHIALSPENPFSRFKVTLQYYNKEITKICLHWSCSFLLFVEIKPVELV